MGTSKSQKRRGCWFCFRFGDRTCRAGQLGGAIAQYALSPWRRLALCLVVAARMAWFPCNCTATSHQDQKSCEGYAAHPLLNLQDHCLQFFNAELCCGPGGPSCFHTRGSMKVDLFLSCVNNLTTLFCVKDVVRLHALHRNCNTTCPHCGQISTLTLLLVPLGSGSYCGAISHVAT